MKLDPPQPLRVLLDVAIENEPGLELAGHDPEQVVKVSPVATCHEAGLCKLNTVDVRKRSHRLVYTSDARCWTSILHCRSMVTRI